MLYYFMQAYPVIATISGSMIAFFATFILLKVFGKKLPTDQGREFAVEGTLSKGKARGAGLIFVLVFTAVSFLFEMIDLETVVYLLVIAATMITGYLDDAAKKPWNEYVKGALDLVLASAVAATYLYYNGNDFVILPYPYVEITIPYVLAFILIVILVWTSINVTNCTDGVDGLSGTLTLVTLGSFLICMRFYGYYYFTGSITFFMAALLAYLWFNANPSTILMGDAGSRAMGTMIAVTALLCKFPALYIPFAIVMLADGGLGLIKVFLLRFLKIGILKNTRCPLHDHARKIHNWSNTQVVFRFAIIQLVVNAPFVMMFVEM